MKRTPFRPVLAVLILAAGSAMSQPAPTACGEGGIGLNGKTKLPEARDATPGKRVGDDLIWANCKMPPDCAAVVEPRWLTCQLTNPLPAAYFGKTYQRHAVDFQGLAYFRCTKLGNGKAAWLPTSTPGKVTYCK